MAVLLPEHFIYCAAVLCRDIVNFNSIFKAEAWNLKSVKYSNEDLQILCRGFECMEALRFNLGEGEDKGSDNDIPETHKV